MKQQLCCSRTGSFNNFLQLPINIIFPLSLVYLIMGGLFGMYAWMYVYLCNLYMHVCVHACMCVCLTNDSVNVTRKQTSWFFVRKIPTFYREAS